MIKEAEHRPEWYGTLPHVSPKQILCAWLDGHRGTASRQQNFGHRSRELLVAVRTDALRTAELQQFAGDTEHAGCEFRLNGIDRSWKDYCGWITFAQNNEIRLYPYPFIASEVFLNTKGLWIRDAPLARGAREAHIDRWIPGCASHDPVPGSTAPARIVDIEKEHTHTPHTAARRMSPKSESPQPDLASELDC